MRRTTIKSPISVLNTSPVVSRICSRGGCGNRLTNTQHKYCSGTCRNLILSPGNNGGAPTKYRQEFSKQLLEEYLDYCERANKRSLIPTKSSYIVFNNADLPSNSGYSRWLLKNRHTETQISSRTLYNWAKRHNGFAYALERIKSFQKELLINNGLSGQYNARLVIFLLNVNHGMVERKETDHTHKMLGFVKQIYKRADEIEQEKYRAKKLT